MEAIRDEQNVAFFVISELSRGTGGQYTKKPDEEKQCDPKGCSLFRRLSP